MAKTRKRTLPSGRVVWLVDYRDQHGKRRAKQFRTKSRADAFETQTRHEVARGVHVADSASVTVAEAADIWLKACEANGLERATIAAYHNHVARHIKPAIGHLPLSRLTAPVAQEFADQLAKTRTRATAGKVLKSLKAIVSEAVRAGRATMNQVREVRLRGSSRDKERALIPSLDEIRLLLKQATGDVRCLVHTAIFTGMRASELRGLVWENVDFKEAIIRVRQRADRFNEMGAPKSEAGSRDIPLGPALLALLREWKVAQPLEVRLNNLVFPDASGEVEDPTTVYRRFAALQVACGVTEPVPGENGRPKLDNAGRSVLRHKYGLHAMRHACASLLIAEGWSPKRIQDFMGHSSIRMTYDVYGHLFKDAEGDQRAMEKLENALLK